MSEKMEKFVADIEVSVSVPQSPRAALKFIAEKLAEHADDAPVVIRRDSRAGKVTLSGPISIVDTDYEKFGFEGTFDLEITARAGKPSGSELDVRAIMVITDSKVK